MRLFFSRPKDQSWCPSCGKRASEHGNFCANCGADLRPPEAVFPLNSPSQVVEVSPQERALRVSKAIIARNLSGPLLLPLGSHAKKGLEREQYAAPFPRCRTTEEILNCQEQARAIGLTVISWHQRPMMLRAPQPGEAGAIVAESIDDQPKPLKQVLPAEIAAMGNRGSRLWVVSDKYPLLGSMAAINQYDRELAAAKKGVSGRQLPASGRKPPPKPQWPTGIVRRMAIWRLIAHHADGEAAVRWNCQEGVIAVGYGGVGDLRRQRFADASELTQVLDYYNASNTASSLANGGRSLWRLYYEMEIGDLVILSTGANGGSQRAATMRVTGDYFFEEDEALQYYEHRRKAEAVSIDPNRLWQLSGGAASGENIRRTLIRCTNTLSEAEYHALLSGSSAVK